MVVGATVSYSPPPSPSPAYCRGGNSVFNSRRRLSFISFA